MIAVARIEKAATVELVGRRSELVTNRAVCARQNRKRTGWNCRGNDFSGHQRF
jgi:hypothetical protein